MKKNQKKNLKKNLHLSYKDRCIIQEFLTYGYSFTVIGTTGGKGSSFATFISPLHIRYKSGKLP